MDNGGRKNKPVLVPADDQTDMICGEGVAVVDDGRGLRAASEREIRELQSDPPQMR